MYLLYNPWLDETAIMVSEDHNNLVLLEYIEGKKFTRYSKLWLIEYKDGTRFASFDNLVKLAGWEMVGKYD